MRLYEYPLMQDHPSSIDPATLPEYNGQNYVKVNGGVPVFPDEVCERAGLIKDGGDWQTKGNLLGTVDSNQLNEKIIRICANVAAYYSQGRYSSSVPVDYCEIRNVKKIKGARPGFVSYRNYKTIYIDPYDDKELNITAI